MFRRQQQKRKMIRNGTMVHNFSKVESRRGFWSKIDMKTRLSVDGWIRNHHHVVHSPIVRDTLLVLDFQSNKIVRKNKLLLQCPVRELHSDLYSPIIGLGNTVRDKKGKHLISDTMFRTLLPQELRPMTDRYKQQCCCAECTGFEYMQS